MTSGGDLPLTGGCLCGAVRFEVSAPILSAGYCHCTHCQKRTGTGSSANCRVAQDDFRIVEGAELLASYQPSTGVPKLFCSRCGSALFSGDPFSDATRSRSGSAHSTPILASDRSSGSSSTLLQRGSRCRTMGCRATRARATPEPRRGLLMSVQ